MRHRVFIGWDPRDELAYRVCCRSMRALTNTGIDIVPIRDADLRRRKIYWRDYYVAPDGQMFDQRDGRPFSTAFSFTRFAVPLMEDFAPGWVLFTDPDTLWRADVADLFALADDRFAVMVVKHQQAVTEERKMDGVLQTLNAHGRKNWSSVMLLNPARCRELTRFQLNNARGEALHAFSWVREAEIGELPARWNHLVNVDEPPGDVAVAHFTLGTPDMAPGDTPLADEWWQWVEPSER